MNDDQKNNPYFTPPIDAAVRADRVEQPKPPRVGIPPRNQNCRNGIILVILGVIIFPPLVVAGILFCHLGLGEIKRAPGDYGSVSKREGRVGLGIGYVFCVAVAVILIFALWQDILDAYAFVMDLL